MHHSLRLTAAAACATLVLAIPARAEDVTVTPFSNLTIVSTSVFNDRIGNSRFFAGANADLVRVSTTVVPSPDSDRFPVRAPDGLLYQSTNGSATTVSLAHPSMVTLPRQVATGFVGLSSGRGGGFNEYMFAFDRATLTAAQLQAWDDTPFQLTARNPLVAAGQTVHTYAAPDFNALAMPAFVTDVRLTGGGLQPRIDWTLPDSAAAPTSVTIQVRRIDAESADRRIITRATLVHNVTLDASATSYSFSEVFSNAGTPGFPTGLAYGSRYEVAVVGNIVVGAQLQGRARSFFELTPLQAGADQVAVYLPSAGPDGRFKFDVAVQSGEQIAIDPDFAVGYDYAVGAGDPLFRSVKLPSVGDGQYGLWLWTGSGYSFQTALAAGSEYFFGGLGVERFRIDGIEVSAGLDPSDPTAFVTTLSFAGSGRFTGTMTPLTVSVPVPEPATLALWAGGLLLLGRRLRRVRRQG